jgi:hypothetical protein
MAGIRFTDLQSRPMEFLDFTSLTLNEFQHTTWKVIALTEANGEDPQIESL